jgi:hypothetical protein
VSFDILEVIDNIKQKQVNKTREKAIILSYSMSLKEICDCQIQGNLTGNADMQLLSFMESLIVRT